MQWLRILECLKLLERDYDDLVSLNSFTDKKKVSEKLPLWWYIDGSRVRPVGYRQKFVITCYRAWRGNTPASPASSCISFKGRYSSSVPVSQVSFWSCLMHMPASACPLLALIQIFTLWGAFLPFFPPLFWQTQSIIAVISLRRPGQGMKVMWPMPPISQDPSSGPSNTVTPGRAHGSPSWTWEW